MNDMKYQTRPNYTRFCPTTNGSLHVGHLYMILVNEAEAHANNGKFSVRFDDNQEVYRWGVSWTGVRMTKDEVEKTKDSMMDDLTWMGVQVDAYLSQSNLEDHVNKFLLHLNHGPLDVKKVYTSQTNPECHWTSFDVNYPYVPWLTAEKVLYDYLTGCNLLIRGDDLLDEWSLYMYFCDLWGLPAPRQVFLKRMRFESGQEMVDISKTRGKGTIKEYRDLKYTPEDLRNELARACLIDPQGEWLISNLKVEPVWKY